MIALIAAAAAFVGIHFFISGTSLRGRLVALIGEGAYRGLFSVASLAAIGWLAASFPRAESESVPLWDFGAAGHWVSVVLMAFAAIFVVVGLTSPNATSLGQEKALLNANPARGITRITRHPFLMGVAIWAIAHLISNGHLASLIFFGAFLILSLIGPMSIDAKLRARDPEHWARFSAVTSILPFAAILSGRNRFAAGELASWQLAAALVIYVGLIAAHPLVFSASAIPN